MSSLLKAAQITFGMERKSLQVSGGLATSLVSNEEVMSTSSGSTSEPACAGDLQKNEKDTQVLLLTELKQQLAIAEAAHAALATELKTQVDAAYQCGWQDGHAKGKTEGAAEVVTSQEQQLTLLKTAMSEANQQFKRELSQIEPLALDITQSIFEKMFGDPGMHAALVIKTARHHLASSMADSAIGLEVSAQDFPDQEVLKAALDGVINQAHFTISANPALPQGACYIRLALGRLNIGLPRQMDVVRSALAGLNG